MTWNEQLVRPWGFEKVHALNMVDPGHCADHGECL
jgi:hypothetical protein